MEVRPLPEPLVRYAEEEIARLQVPGAAVGVLHDGVIYAAGVGVTNVEHPLPVTAETLFQIGSTSKTFTATALMALVEAGKVDLDATVRTYLPWFALQSEEDAAKLTVRDLVTHHAGYVGDYFKDTGRGDDAIGTIVRKMANSPQLAPAGYTFSYSNAAFYVLGHIVETIHGRPFEHVIRETIFEPLGMDLSFYFPEETITHRVAAGHIVTTEGPKVARPWNTPRSIAPGGGVTSNVLDQLHYAALHIGQARESGVLSRASITAMQQAQRPAGSMCESIGISWMLDWAGEGVSLVKHGGATNGHLSSFELVPSKGFAVTVLTNSDTGRETRQTIADRCQEHFLGFGKPEPVAMAPQPGLREYEGTYQSVLARLEVSAANGQLLVTDATPERGFAERRHRTIPLPPAELVFTAPDATAVLSGPRKGERAEFLRGDDGSIEWMRWDGRIARRIEG
ncbi:MAG: serine hydrolase domain-containing protein [Dehalococcoidia bacterium]|jgi:CubicO group peptidase (beta-lactamase class C family)